jgi:beta-galactosidase
VDLCGFPKDRYYLYRSHWLPEEPTLHLLPHWSWPGREGEVTPVYCYTSFPSAELFVNGVSQGVRQKDPESELDRYRLRWNDVVYQPGEIRVVALDGQGNPARELTIRTTGAPEAIRLEAGAATISSLEDELCYIAVRGVDANGDLCPHADNEISFSVEGPGSLRAVASGDPTSLESFQSTRRRLFHGLCQAIISAKPEQTGTITITAEAEGLRSASVEIRAVNKNKE